MSRFAFESANAVAVGTFNIHIFTPPWLKASEIVQEEPEAVEVALHRPGCRIRLEDPNCVLTIEPSRIEVSTTTVECDCGALLARILRKLPETPLVAVGTNVTYSCTFEEGGVPEAISRLPSEVRGTRPSRSFAGLRFEAGENRSKSIGLEQAGRAVKATGNSEYRVANVDSRRSNVDLLVSAAEGFLPAIEDLARLIAEAWNVEIDH